MPFKFNPFIGNLDEVQDISGKVDQTNPVLDGIISGTAFKDEDTMSSDSAVAVASQQSIKAYVDNSLGNTVTEIDNTDSPYSVTTATDTLLADATSGAITVNLPTAVGISGQTFTIKKVGTGYNNVTVDPNGAQTIDGASTYVLYIANEYIQIRSNGTNWELVAEHLESIECRATLSSADVGVTDKVVPFDGSTFDNVSGLNTSTGVYTTKAPGSYLISTRVVLDNSGTPNDDRIFIRINSSNYAERFGGALAGTTSSTDTLVSDIAQLDEGDTIDTFANGDASFTISGISIMTIKRISK